MCLPEIKNIIRWQFCHGNLCIFVLYIPSSWLCFVNEDLLRGLDVATAINGLVWHSCLRVPGFSSGVVSSTFWPCVSSKIETAKSKCRTMAIVNVADTEGLFEGSLMMEASWNLHLSRWPFGVWHARIFCI